MAPPRRPDWSGRLARLHRTREDAGLGALVLSAPPSLIYLCGFDGSSGLLLLAPDGTHLLVDGRYEALAAEARAAGALAGVELVAVERRFDLTLAAELARRAVARAGFEARHVTVATLARWREAAAGVSWEPTDGLVERMRLVKDDWEVAVFREAGARLAGMARALSDWVRPGRSEREIAADLDAALLRAGFSGPAFETIVASGPRSAWPHARAADRRLAAGDLVVLDFGGVLDRYCVDLTRMAGVGPVRPDAESLYQAVRDAHTAAVAAVRPGVGAPDVDRAARQVLDDRGLGAAVRHATGHGLGLEVHEAPRLGRADTGDAEVLAPGMVVAIEPGAYVDGLGGARLEDDVLVTAGGGEVLTEAPRDLLVV